LFQRRRRRRRRPSVQSVSPSVQDNATSEHGLMGVVSD